MRDHKGKFVKGHAPILQKNPPKGVHYSPATEIKKGQRIGQETEFKKGISASPATQFKKGISVSPSTQFKKGQVSNNKGKKASEETRQKLRAYWAVRREEVRIRTTDQKARYNLMLASIEWKALRKVIIARDVGQCKNCLGPGHHVDHIIPWRISEDNSELNLQLLCASCNSLKVHKDKLIKVAVVTGNSRGIGKAITEEFRSKGIFVFDISRTTGYDLSTEEGQEKARPMIERADILIHNFGGGGGWGLYDVVATPKEVWGQVYEKNAGAAYKLTLQALPYMQKRKWGRVICITSVGNDRPWFNMAKAAEESLVHTLSQRKEYVRKGITFNCVAPGRIFIPGKDGDLTPAVLKRDYLMGRVGTPKDVAWVVGFLCSENATYINGIVFPVDGGGNI